MQLVVELKNHLFLDKIDDKRKNRESLKKQIKEITKVKHSKNHFH